MADELILAPCPFCGGEASSLRDEDDCPYVACTSCHINLPAYRPGFEAKAAADWNRRAAPIAAQLDAEGLPPLPKSSANGDSTVDYFGRPYEFTAEQVRQAQRDAVAAYIDGRTAGTTEAWISVTDRLPEVGDLVLVYSPPTQYDHPGSVNIGFDCIDPDADEPTSWLNHNEHYEHFCCVAKPEGSVGPSADAPYTHWKRVAAPSPQSAAGEKGQA